MWECRCLPGQSKAWERRPPNSLVPSGRLMESLGMLGCTRRYPDRGGPTGGSLATNGAGASGGTRPGSMTGAPATRTGVFSAFVTTIRTGMYLLGARRNHAQRRSTAAASPGPGRPHPRRTGTRARCHHADRNRTPPGHPLRRGGLGLGRVVRGQLKLGGFWPGPFWPPGFPLGRCSSGGLSLALASSGTRARRGRSLQTRTRSDHQRNADDKNESGLVHDERFPGPCGGDEALRHYTTSRV